MPGFDPRKPGVARVYDYLLGGKDHFAADREMGDRLVAVFPPAADLVPENRQFSRVPSPGRRPAVPPLRQAVFAD